MNRSQTVSSLASTPLSSHSLGGFWSILSNKSLGIISRACEFNVKVAKTKKEITELLEAGFEWVGQDGDGLTYFRKRK